MLKPQETGVVFSNEMQESEQLNILTFEYFNNGAGVGIGDIDNDGLQDLFFSGNMVGSRLYRNKGNFQFEDITKSAGIRTEGKWATGVSMVDINADGLLDIYVCMAGPWGPEKRANECYINRGNGAFEEQAAALGLADTGHTTQAAFFDYDLDGDLDVYLLTNIMEALGPNVIRPKKLNGQSPNTDRLYRNDGGKFTDVSRQAGILKEGYGLGVSIADFNQDGWPDIYVSNDYLSNDLLYLNQQNGSFRDRAEECFRHTSYSAMGNDVADMNNDGLPDIFTVDMLPPDNLRRKLMFPSINYDRFRSELISGYYPQYVRNTLQLHQGRSPEGLPVFSEIGQLAGVQSTDWSWSALMADVDNDGWKDLLITNGYPRDITNLDFVAFKMDNLLRGNYTRDQARALLEALKQVEGAHLPNYLFQNRGDLRFQDRSHEWGFTQPSYSHGAALADLDNDGDLDYVVSNTNQAAFIYRNRSERLSKRHYLRLELKGDQGNRAGFGTKVWLYTAGKMQYQECSPYRGFQSSIEPYLHFGLDTALQVDSLRVRWPDGREQRWKNLAVDQLMPVLQSEAQVSAGAVADSPPQALFEGWQGPAAPEFRHIEEHYADFKVQPLLPHKHSQEGPRLATGDMNGDGLSDFYVGGAFKHSGYLFFQQKNGSFLSRALSAEPKYEEETGCLLFDADGDGDLDLYLCCGGAEFPDQSPYYQDRLFRNDGKGGFTHDPSALPRFPTSTSCVAAADYDQDGDLDLFVGGRVVPGDYAETPESFLLENRDGRFFPATRRFCPQLSRIGRVTAACWADLDGDKRPDLLLAGEWMPVCLFRNTGKRLVPFFPEGPGLENTIGWWNCLSTADIDGDGDMDFAAGNLGLNSPFQAGGDFPTRIYWNDFDQNGRQEGIMTYYLQGREVPVPFRNDLLAWLNPLKKKFTSYSAYAQASWPEVFPRSVLEACRISEASCFESSWFEQREGRFIRHALPVQAQFAPVNAILIDDFDGDRHLDVLLAGNSFATETHTGRYDALNGLLLGGKGQGHFRVWSLQESGVYLPGDVRDLAQIRLSDKRRVVLAARNDDFLRALQIPESGAQPLSHR